MAELKVSELNALLRADVDATADLLLIADTSTSESKSITPSNLPCLLTTAADFSGTFSEKTAPVGADLILIEDSDDGDAKKKVQLSNLPGATITSFTPLSLADDVYVGTTIAGTAGEALTQWDAVYLKSDGKFWKAKADSATTAPAAGVAIAAADADAAVTILVWGFFRDDGGATLTVGGLMYLSGATAGLLTSTAPSTAGYQVQIIGLALAAQIRAVWPNLGLVEIASA